MPADTTHAWVLDRLSAHIDGELDAAEAIELAGHLTSCASCSQEYARLLDTVRSMHNLMPPLRAPEKLRARVVTSIRNAANTVRSKESVRTVRAPRPLRQWLIAATLVAILGTGYALGARYPTQARVSLAEAALSAHVRSLQLGHLTDVASTDQHTVKPWFTGKLDFSPVVPRLESQGFPLIGGRLDYIGDHAAAALVYRRRAHTVNLWTYPSATATAIAPHMETRRGYQIASWSAGGMDYWVVTDLNADELRTFCSLVREAASTP